MDILVHREFLGTPLHALLSDSMLKWTSSEKCDLIYGAKKNPKSIEPLLRLFQIEIPELVPKQFKRALHTCGDESPPWQMIIPKRLYNKNLKAVLKSLSQAIIEIKDSKYCSVYLESNKLFQYLQPATLDIEKSKKILTSEDNHIVRSILGMSEGTKCPIPIYDRVSTKTGRLTIKQGPQVLTLKKDYRDIFRANSSSAKLYEVDFSSLEPRVASNIAQRSPGKDVYMSFMEYAGINISRDAAKLAVLCSLYGAGKYNLQNQLKKQNSKVSADFLIRKVKDYFSVNKLLTSLKSQAKESGFIKNYFDRPIIIDDARDSVLINNYLQSTAVDVSLMGFKKFCDDMKDKIRPVFIIHDALFFELEDNYLSDVKEYLSNGFDLEGLGNFPLTITEFTK